MLDQEDIDKFRNVSISPSHHIIDGNQCRSISGKTSDVLSPLNGKVLCSISSGDEKDVQLAVQTSRKSFTDRRWSGQTPNMRKKIMHKWADLIEAETLELCILGVRDNGTNISMAIKAEVGSAIATIRYYAEAIDKIYGQIAPNVEGSLGLIHKEPVGVVAVIVPWNFPLMIGAWKLGPAIAAGNSVILKPAESASLALLRISELALEAGLPPGVLNVVTGKGSIVGEALALSNDIDAIVFTGSGYVGRQLLQNSAKSNLKRCYLELGGKSPNIIFNDVKDIVEAAKISATGIFRNSGQVCIAGSRLLIQNDIYEDFMVEMAKFSADISPGDPLNMNSSSGAINNLNQLEQNLKFVDIAQKEGGNLYMGGRRVMQDTGGYFMEPTIITNVKISDIVAQKEVFGPVLAVSTFETEEEAVSLANSTDYGLAAGVWTSDLSRAHRMVRSIKSGLVHVNTYGGSDLTVPLGGMKQSGNGYDKSLHAFDKYLNLKSAWIQLD